MSPLYRGRIMPSSYFKVVRASNTRKYHLDPSWTISDFYNIMKSRIIRDFNIEHFVLVEAGQNLPVGIDSEDGIPLNKNDTTSLQDLYGDVSNVSFYIRPITQDVSEQLFSETIRHIQSTPEVECVLCYENTPRRNQYGYGCGHALCSRCLNGCRRNTIRCCPICRREG